ncbi:MAG: glycosyltransferase family 9 protein [Microscillaceae bacterium]|jgi:ADP-heptose:LPS heptosyltransferase|nr:glycosyltransferase family 9 protein [Microscillaceae bacterium]
MKPKTKILIIRFSSIGDIVWTSLVVRCLKEQMPNIELHFAVKAGFASLVKHNPHIDRLHLLADNLEDLIQGLRAENFDLIIDLHNNLRSNMIRWRLGKKTYAYNKHAIHRWLLNRFKINTLPPNQHIADWYFEALAPLHIVNDGKGLDFYLAPEDEVALHTLPTTHQNGFIALIIGGSAFTKKLPFEKLVELCQKIDYPLVLIGGKEDEAAGEQLLNYFAQKLPILNACGKYTLNQSASLVKQALCVFGHDTGHLHIAAAFKKKVYAIFGTTFPEVAFPYGTEYQILENKGLACRPCSKSGRKSCPKGHFKCMRELKIAFEKTW